MCVQVLSHPDWASLKCLVEGVWSSFWLCFISHQKEVFSSDLKNCVCLCSSTPGWSWYYKRECHPPQSLDLAAHVWGCVGVSGVQYSWQTAAESPRPPRGSVLAWSDTEAHTCSSEEGDLTKCWPLHNPLVHTLDSHSCPHIPNVYHLRQVTWDQILRCVFPAGTRLPLSLSASANKLFKHHQLYTPSPIPRRSLIDPAVSSHADVLDYVPICGRCGSVILTNTPVGHAGSDL